MSFIFSLTHNQATVPITTTNSNTLVTLTFSASITTTAISSASITLSTSPVRAISVAGTGQDANFETRLNTMENDLYKLGSTLEKSHSTNNPSVK